MKKRTAKRGGGCHPADIRLASGFRRGQGLVEYGLILALVVIICIAGLTSVGQHPTNMVTEVSNAFPEGG